MMSNYLHFCAKPRVAVQFFLCVFKAPRSLLYFWRELYPACPLKEFTARQLLALGFAERRKSIKNDVFFFQGILLNIFLGNVICAKGIQNIGENGAEVEYVLKVRPVMTWLLRG